MIHFIIIIIPISIFQDYFIIYTSRYSFSNILGSVIQIVLLLIL